ncbi:MAG: GreA/GreB family elongation factor, partial [Planctomycetota bacterium]
HRRRDAVTGRLNTRLSEMLTKGREPLLRKLLDDADYDALRSAQMSVQRGVEESIDNLVSALVARAAPAPKDSDVNRFWETNSTWTTRKGLQHRQAELREILEEKIPAAEDAIGKAASYGDLSENAEWTAAVEERRNLSELVDGMQRDLAKVDLIETAPREDGVVAPGSRVRYKSVKGGEENTISILGPWDTNFGDDIVSYRAPLAAGLLGLTSGETATLELPGGNQEVEVLEVLEAALAE